MNHGSHSTRKLYAPLLVGAGMAVLGGQCYRTHFSEERMLERNRPMIFRNNPMDEHHVSLTAAERRKMQPQVEEFRKKWRGASKNGSDMCRFEIDYRAALETGTASEADKLVGSRSYNRYSECSLKSEVADVLPSLKKNDPKNFDYQPWRYDVLLFGAGIVTAAYTAIRNVYDYAERKIREKIFKGRLDEKILEKIDRAIQFAKNMAVLSVGAGLIALGGHCYDTFYSGQRMLDRMRPMIVYSVTKSVNKNLETVSLSTSELIAVAGRIEEFKKQRNEANPTSGDLCKFEIDHRAQLAAEIAHADKDKFVAMRSFEKYSECTSVGEMENALPSMNKRNSPTDFDYSPWRYEFYIMAAGLVTSVAAAFKIVDFFRKKKDTSIHENP